MSRRRSNKKSNQRLATRDQIAKIAGKYNLITSGSRNRLADLLAATRSRYMTKTEKKLIEPFLSNNKNKKIFLRTFNNRRSGRRVSRKRVSRKRVSRKRVSKRGSRRRLGRKNINYRMYGHAVLWGHDYTKRVPCSRPLSFLADARHTGKLWEHDYTKPVSSREVFLRKIGNVVPPLPDDTRGLIFDEFCRQKFKRKARFMDATVYLYGGYYGHEAERYFDDNEDFSPEDCDDAITPPDYYDDFTIINSICERYSNKHNTTIEKFININNLKPGDILFVGSDRTVEAQRGGQDGFGFVTNKIRGRISRKLTFTYSENAGGGGGIRDIIWEGREKFGKYVNYKKALRELIQFCSVGRGSDYHCGDWDNIPEGWCEHDGQCEEQEMCQEYLEELEKPWVDTKGILGPHGQIFKRYDRSIFYGWKTDKFGSALHEDDRDYYIGELYAPHATEEAIGELEVYKAHAPFVYGRLGELLGFRGQTIVKDGKRTADWVPLHESHKRISVGRDNEDDGRYGEGDSGLYSG